MSLYTKDEIIWKCNQMGLKAYKADNQRIRTEAPQCDAVFRRCVYRVCTVPQGGEGLYTCVTEAGSFAIPPVVGAVVRRQTELLLGLFPFLR